MDRVISFTSFVVALAALVIAVMAWRRPFPADPTAIPTFGRALEPVNLDDPKVANAFFGFLRDNAGRKILLYVGMGKDCINSENFSGPTNSDGLTDVLYVPKRPDNERAFGIEYQHGVYLLRGYFANSGVVGLYQGQLVHRLTPLSDDEAVN